MNENSKPLPEQSRFKVNLAIGKFLGKTRIDFELFRVGTDKTVLEEIADAKGFNANHPNFGNLIWQINRSFTMEEISHYMGCLFNLEVLEMDIRKAVFQLSDPEIPQKGISLLCIPDRHDEFDFSALEDYDLPFVIKGQFDKNYSSR